jgi:dGTPase
MDLTRRTLLGLVKYPIFIENRPNYSESESVSSNHILLAKNWKPIKGLFTDDQPAFDWLLSSLSIEDVKLLQSVNDKPSQLAPHLQPFKMVQSKFKSFDASIMELADDIAYGVHDFEDAIALDKIKKHHWREEVLPELKQINNPWTIKHADHLTEMLFSEKSFERKNAIGALVNHLITNIQVETTDPQFKEPLLAHNVRLNEAAAPILNHLKAFVYKYVIQATELQQLEFRGQRMLMMMFEAFKTDPERLLPKAIYQLWSEENANPNRVISDYLASMSDDHATRSFQTLFNNHI